MLDVHAIKDKQLLILVLYFFGCTVSLRGRDRRYFRDQSKCIKRAVLNNRILIFNAKSCIN